MYSYYLFSALGPRFQKFLWWKKYLTALQMVRIFIFKTKINNNQKKNTFKTRLQSRQYQLLITYLCLFFRFNSWLLWCMRSNCCSLTVTIQEHLSGGLVCMLSCSFSYSTNSTNQHTNKIWIE